jgi:hypothetical protein
MLEDKGAPGVVERTLIRPPSSQLGPISPAARADAVKASPVFGKYDETKDRESAYELLKAKAERAAKEAETAELAAEEAEEREREYNRARRYDGKSVGRSSSRRETSSGGIGAAIGDVVIKELKGTTGRRIVRGILGGLFRAR